MNNQVSQDDPQAGKAVIQITDLGKRYRGPAGDIHVLKGADLNIYPGEMVAVMGPSGVGKSTLLYILGLFLKPTSGTYRCMGKNVLKLTRKAQAEFRRRQIGFIFQSADLLEKSTVYENLEFPLIYSHVRRRERKSLIAEALNRVNLFHRIHHAANRLSGGEMQRVAVARALVNKPNILLADEPTGQLDHENSKLIVRHLRKVVDDSDTSVVIVTHDRSVASKCDRMYQLTDGVLTESESTSQHTSKNES